MGSRRQRKDPHTRPRGDFKPTMSPVLPCTVQGRLGHPGLSLVPGKSKQVGNKEVPSACSADLQTPHWEQMGNRRSCSWRGVPWLAPPLGLQPAPIPCQQWARCQGVAGCGIAAPVGVLPCPTLTSQMLDAGHLLPTLHPEVGALSTAGGTHGCIGDTHLPLPRTTCPTDLSPDPHSGPSPCLRHQV